MSIKPNISPFETTQKILTTLKEMLQDRCYKPINPNDFNTCASSNEDLKYVAVKKCGSLIFVYFATDVKIPIKKAREYIEHMKAWSVNHAIIVYASQITPNANAAFLNKKTADFELFKAIELYQNITKHQLVPHHSEIQTEQELKKIMNDCKVESKDKFPKYYTFDPVVKYFHWPVGTVVCIHRKLGGLQEPINYYRCVHEWQQ